VARRGSGVAACGARPASNARRRTIASANAPDAKRQFLVDHVEKVIYEGYKITIAGSVPVQTASGETKLQFRIKGEIDRRSS
jgi:hypothetical protein